MENPFELLDQRLSIIEDKLDRLIDYHLGHNKATCPASGNIDSSHNKHAGIQNTLL